MGTMDWDFGSFGGQLLWSLESLGKGTVTFCDVYILRGEFCTIGDHHDQFLWFPYFGKWGVLRLELVTFTLLPWFWAFVFI